MKWRGLFSLGAGGARRGGGWAAIGAEGGAAWDKERDALLCAGELSRARLSKDAGCVAVTTDSALFGTSAFLLGHGSFPPPLPCRGKVRMPLAGRALCAAPCPAPCALLPARVDNYRNGLCHKSLPSVQGASFAEQKDLEGMRGYGFKKAPAERKKGMLSPTCDCTRELCSLPERSASLVLPAAMPAPGSLVCDWGIG